MEFSLQNNKEGIIASLFAYGKQINVRDKMYSNNPHPEDAWRNHFSFTPGISTSDKTIDFIYVIG